MVHSNPQLHYTHCVYMYMTAILCFRNTLLHSPTVTCTVTQRDSIGDQSHDPRYNELEYHGAESLLNEGTLQLQMVVILPWFSHMPNLLGGALRDGIIPSFSTCGSGSSAHLMLEKSLYYMVP